MLQPVAFFSGVIIIIKKDTTGRFIHAFFSVFSPKEGGFFFLLRHLLEK